MGEQQLRRAELLRHPAVGAVCHEAGVVSGLQQQCSLIEAVGASVADKKPVTARFQFNHRKGDRIAGLGVQPGGIPQNAEKQGKDGKAANHGARFSFFKKFFVAKFRHSKPPHPAFLNPVLPAFNSAAIFLNSVRSKTAHLRQNRLFEPLPFIQHKQIKPPVFTLNAQPVFCQVENHVFLYEVQFCQGNTELEMAVFKIVEPKKNEGFPKLQDAGKLSGAIPKQSGNG
ncbi:MAG: hypothetical protein IPM81_06155 [Saprospirales bacterium]|nr:hypothetical protein [Saprospirales bacterium]